MCNLTFTDTAVRAGCVLFDILAQLAQPVPYNLIFTARYICQSRVVYNFIFTGRTVRDGSVYNLQVELPVLIVCNLLLQLLEPVQCMIWR